MFELSLVPEQNSLINLLFQNLQEPGYIKLESALTFTILDPTCQSFPHM